MDKAAIERAEMPMTFMFCVINAGVFLGIYGVAWLANMLCEGFLSFTFDVKYVALVALVLWSHAGAEWSRLVARIDP